ncbi:MAG: metal-binding protein [Betaproteobacteria bacterium HGW-Betaproteobacteria-14]|nr:MAG: metal-binding protein [Betaproteobacteria bacterium HGW-Betaproteobacteria-14]
MKTSKFLATALLTLAALGAGAEPLPEVVMHKDPNCGCCGKWAEHLEASGFKVITVPERDMQAVKTRLGVPQRLGSCHTAKVGNYVIEGHVPAATIKRLLSEKPAVRGLAAPGMPLASPGMDVPGNKDPYDVIAFDRAGKTRVYEQIR